MRAKRTAVRRAWDGSFVALIADITGIPMQDERAGIWRLPNPAGEVIRYILTAPEWTPARFTDRSQLANTVNEIEKAEKLPNSHVGEHWEPDGGYEFSELDHLDVVTWIARELTARYQVFVVGSIHKLSDFPYYRYHFGFNARQITPEGLGKKEGDHRQVDGA